MRPQFIFLGFTVVLFASTATAQKQELQYRVLAQTGTVLPGAAPNESLSILSFESWAINNAGVIIFGANGDSSISGESSFVAQSASTSFAIQIQTGQAVSLLDPGLQWAKEGGRFGSMQINDIGESVILGKVTDGGEPFDIAIRRLGTLNRKILQGGQDAPGVPGRTLAWMIEAQINNAGTVAIHLGIEPGDSTGVWIDESNTVSPFVYDGQDLGLGVTWQSFVSLDLNDTESTLFSALTEFNNDALTFGIFSKDLDGSEVGKLRLNRLAGVPGSGGALTMNFPVFATANVNGKVAFTSELSDNQGDTGIAGLFFADLPEDGGLTNITDAFAGQSSLPAGRTLSSIYAISINASGSVAFQAYLDNNDGDSHLYLLSPGERSRLIAGEKEPLVLNRRTVTPRAVRILPHSLTDSGEVLFTVQDTGNIEYLVAARVVAVDPPSISVNGKSRRPTSRPKINLRGNIQSNGEISFVQCKPHGKSYKPAALNVANKRWTARVPLRPGRNVIRLRCEDTLGQRSGIVKVRVTRR
jgi:hypothetical protein